jgi:adenosylcobinamide-GDP ribazoletransferase
VPVNALRDSFSLFQRDFALALRHYTGLRTTAVDVDLAAPEDATTGLLAHLPGVGWLVGLAGCLLFALVSLPLRDNPWSVAVAAVASTIATVLLTGALHESALYRRAETLEGRLPGAATSSGLGSLALLLVLAAKFVLLAALAAASEAAIMATLFAGHVFSRFVPVAVAHWTTPAQVDRRALRTAALWVVVPLALLVPAGGLALLIVPLVVAGLAVYALLHFLRRRRTAFDDTVVGTVQQVCEVAFYLGAVMGGG